MLKRLPTRGSFLGPGGNGSLFLLCEVHFQSAIKAADAKKYADRAIVAVGN
jgi:hypothetical protein